MSTYEDRFEQQQLEQNDGTTKSIHQKSGAGRTDSVAREGTRDTSSKPQSTENWCKQYAAEPRCQTNNYCTTNNICTSSTRVEPSSTREGASDSSRTGNTRGCTTVECWCTRNTLEECLKRNDCVERGFCADEDDSDPTRID